MKLTGKAKSAFKEFRVKNYPDTKYLIEASDGTVWEFLPDALQFGAYVDWADSVGINIDIRPVISNKLLGFYLVINNDAYVEDSFFSREEARELAIKKLDELYNKQI